MKCIIIADRPYSKKNKHWNGCSLVNSRSTLLDTQIKCLKKVFDDVGIYYVYGFDSKKVEKYISTKKYSNFHPIYNKDYAVSGEVQSIRQAIDCIDEECLIMSSQNHISPKTFKDFIDTNHLYTCSENTDELSCRINSMGKVQFISYGLANPVANMYYIDKKSITLFRKNALKQKHRNYFIFEIINQLIDEGIRYSHIQIENKVHTS